MAGIIIVECEIRNQKSPVCFPEALPANWACIDLLGRSVVDRVVARFKHGGVDLVFVVPQHPNSVGPTNDGEIAWEAAAARVAECKSEPIGTVLIACCGTYAELNVAQMLAFHREQGEPVSRAFAADGPLDLWMIDPKRFSEGKDLRERLLAIRPAYYEFRGYVNHLRQARDFRRLVLDSFGSRCELRPQGSEVRPGVWIAENAEIRRGARIVAPAFIGRGAKIGDDCLITRGTNVERNSQVDFGTAAEDSSILSNTYLGIGLDLSHSIVDGKHLWNLEHDVTLEITDPVVMRQTSSHDEGRQQWSAFQDEALNLSAQGTTG